MIQSTGKSRFSVLEHLPEKIFPTIGNLFHINLIKDFKKNTQEIKIQQWDFEGRHKQGK